MKRITYLILLCTLAIVAKAQQFDGSWTGTLNIMGNALHLVFNLEKQQSSYSATLDSPDQGAKGIAMEVVQNGDSIVVSSKKLSILYNGKLEGDSIVGTFHQGAFATPMALKQGTVAINRPQTPTAPFPYVTEEVTFSNIDNSAILSGTISYPIGYEKSKYRNVPLVVMVTGSGQQNRDEEVFQHKPFLVIADYLARHGIASLRYDDRGFGKSTGDASRSTTFDNMNDALSAIYYAKNSGKFGKIGVLGHSEGGSIAFMLASRKKADFIVSMAGVALRGDSILIMQNKLSLAQHSVPQNIIDNYTKALQLIYDYKRTSGTCTSPQSTLDSLLASSHTEISYAPLKSNLIEMLKINSPWINYFIAYDPTADIKRISCPALILNGEKDTQVFCNPNLDAIKASIPSNKFTQIKAFPNLNHLFQHCNTGNVSEYGKIEETISPEVLSTIASWINTIK